MSSLMTFDMPRGIRSPEIGGRREDTSENDGDISYQDEGGRKHGRRRWQTKVPPKQKGIFLSKQIHKLLSINFLHRYMIDFFNDSSSPYVMGMHTSLQRLSNSLITTHSPPGQHVEKLQLPETIEHSSAPCAGSQMAEKTSPTHRAPSQHSSCLPDGVKHSLHNGRQQFS